MKDKRSEQWIFKLFVEVAKNNFNYDVDVPVKINNKIRSYLGRTISIIENNNYKCIGFDFNKVFVNEDYPVEEIINTFKHELVHWHTDTEYNQHCHHDERFISNCEKFGVIDVTDFQRYKPRKKLKKEEFYEAKCCGCDRVVAKCKSFNNLKKFMNRCGGTVCNCGNPRRYVMDKGIKRIYCHENPLAPPEYKVQSWFEGDWVDKLKIILCKE